MIRYVNTPSNEQLKQALEAASNAHHDYQSNVLSGKHDQQWPGWYAAYILGRLGDFVSSSQLTILLENVPGDGDWNDSASKYILKNLRS